MRDIQRILAQFPGPVVLKASRLKWSLVLAGCLVFVGIAVLLLTRPPDEISLGGQTGLWLCGIFFGIGAGVAMVALLPGAGRLTLGPDGFEARTLFKPLRSRWDEVSGFGTALAGRQRLVVFDTADLDGSAASMSTAITGRNSALPDTYGLAVDDLAQLMVDWQRRALG